MSDRTRAQASDDPEPVRVRPVTGKISVRAFEGGGGSSGTPGWDEAEPAASVSIESATGAPSSGELAETLPWVAALPSGTVLTRWIRRVGIPALLAAIAVVFLTHDPRLGVAAGLVAGMIAISRTIDRRMTFSFGAGFLGYRSDMGWPLHVQEDDDFRWQWGPSSAAGGGQGSGSS